MRTYYQLIKPGIVYGNAMTALAAFVFASTAPFNFPLLFATLFGLSFSIAAACVVNNIIDRDIDVHMERTKKRAIPTGQISIRKALIFAAVLGVIGFSLLFFYTNLYALFVTLFGVVVYLGLYTPLKRTTPHSTIVGALAGAVPPVVGYVAVTNELNGVAVLLFLILVCWQMTHFFAISLFRMEEYRKAGLPVMSVYAGVMRTKIVMVLYTVLFGFALFALVVTTHLGLLFTIPMTVTCVGWIILSGTGFHTKKETRWARSMFFYSLFALTLFSVLLALS